MKDKPVKKRIVRVQNKGMITLPVIFRRKLKISENDLLEVEINENDLTVRKLSQEKAQSSDYGLYSQEEIDEMVKKDILHPKIAKKLQSLLLE